jgi:transcriptional regulator with XRE-family HTH domain
LRARRKAARQTQREVARRVGISQASLSNYERGKRDMSISTGVALVTVLGMDLNDLL